MPKLRTPDSPVSPETPDPAFGQTREHIGPISEQDVDDAMADIWKIIQKAVNWTHYTGIRYETRQDSASELAIKWKGTLDRHAATQDREAFNDAVARFTTYQYAKKSLANMAYNLVGTLDNNSGTDPKSAPGSDIHFDPTTGEDNGFNAGWVDRATGGIRTPQDDEDPGIDGQVESWPIRQLKMLLPEGRAEDLLAVIARMNGADPDDLTSLRGAYQAQVTDMLVREVLLDVLADRGRCPEPPDSHILDWHIDFYWNHYRPTHHAADLGGFCKAHPEAGIKNKTAAHRRLVELINLLRTCIYVDDLLAAPRDPIPVAAWTDAPQGPALDPEHRQRLLEPRRRHLQACLDVLDRTGDQPVLTADQARTLRTAASALTRTADRGERVDVDAYMRALDAKVVEQSRHVIKKRLKEDPDGPARDLRDRLLHPPTDASVLEHVSAVLSPKVAKPQIVRLARIIAARTKRPDPKTRRVGHFDPTARAERLLYSIRTGNRRAMNELLALIHLHRDQTDRGAGTQAIASLFIEAVVTQPQSPRAVLVRTLVERWLNDDDTKFINDVTDSFYGTTVTDRVQAIVEANSIRLHADDLPQVVTDLHGIETFYATWIHDHLDPDRPLTLNCVSADDPHNPYLDRIAEITL